MLTLIPVLTDEYNRFKNLEDTHFTTIENNVEYLAIRCDMRNFSRYRKTLKKYGYHVYLEDAMIETVKQFKEQIFEVIEVFAFSDEVSIIIKKNEETRKEKYITQIASYITALFNLAFRELYPHSRICTFDGRIVCTGDMSTMKEYVNMRRNIAIRHGLIKATGKNLYPQDIDLNDDLLDSITNTYGWKKLTDYSKRGFYVSIAEI